MTSGSCFAVTVTVQTACAPEADLAVITAVPVFTAVTLPFGSTAATAGSEEVKVTASPAGVVTAVRTSVSPFSRVREDLSSWMVGSAGLSPPYIANSDI